VFCFDLNLQIGSHAILVKSSYLALNSTYSSYAKGNVSLDRPSIAFHSCVSPRFAPVLWLHFSPVQSSESSNFNRPGILTPVLTFCCCLINSFKHDVYVNSKLFEILFLSQNKEYVFITGTKLLSLLTYTKLVYSENTAKHTIRVGKIEFCGGESGETHSCHCRTQGN
jgi:hypothetical protein